MLALYEYCDGGTELSYVRPEKVEAAAAGNEHSHLFLQSNSQRYAVSVARPL